MTSLRSILTLNDGGDFVAAVPYLLGFNPVDSVVVLTVLHDTDGARVGPIMRVDLPEPGDAAALARKLAAMARQHDIRQTFVLIAGGQGRLGHRPLVDALRAEFDDIGAPVAHAMWARAAEKGRRWWCYVDPACTGTVSDPDSSPLAAMMTVAGLVRYPSREAMAASLAPDPPEALRRRSALLDALVDDELRAADDGTCDRSALAKDMAVVHAAIDMLASSTVEVPALDDEHLARLAFALNHSDVRGECMRIILTDRVTAANRLWTCLTRAFPAPERAEPACLLAIGAYLGGEGTLAHIALDVALEANRGHALAGLLRAAVEQAIAPDELRGIVLRSTLREAA